MKILLVDNYDSFTYNLKYLLDIEGVFVDVYRNDKMDLKTLSNYQGVVLSPGPGLPKEAGDLLEIVGACKERVPLLGICLGHQAIAQSYGAKLRNLKRVAHGVSSQLAFTEHANTLFRGLKEGIDIGRYHSWVVDQTGFPSDLLITSTDEKSEIMSFAHRVSHVYGLQFHPESILTPEGALIMKNFIDTCKENS